ncbi:BTB/POZ domain-containing protein 6-A-like [Paramacrobiotus metropolitanus]|uniref:BTB/POZ domain-containing protein 6-A-like n=1 Tax=Paramacrobiotus metropolitanus TaxID=2943436 RepID=UPI002445756A|nr:BTB/POZ domain-containing protein 6-A-like [Paramacrobiotus metropolitanus]
MVSTKHAAHEEPAVGPAICMKQMLASGAFSDVRFAVGRYFGAVKIFEAHKNILAMHSSAFRNMLYRIFPDSYDGSIPIDIPDFTPDAFANLLSYMYTDEAENLSPDNVFDTMKCADKYDVAPLVLACADEIVSQLNVTNCLSTLEQAVQCHAGYIVEECLNLLDEKAEEILRSEHFTNIRQDTLRTILQRNTLSADEGVIFLAMESWSVEACKRNNMEPSAVNRRQMLGDAFPLALGRFPKLAELPDGPEPIGVLNGMTPMTVSDFVTAVFRLYRNRRLCRRRIAAELSNGLAVTIDCPF